jgi:septum formation topological specificity factor MinE
VRAEIPEAEVYEILEVLFTSGEVSKERMRNLITDHYREQAVGEVSHDLEDLKKELQGCSAKLGKLTDVYLDGNIGKDIFEGKAQKLRNEEGEIRIKIERMELQLVEKEKSKDYVKRAEEVVKSADSFRENLHPALRKELLKLVFKKLVIDHQRISSFELYEPFQGMYDKALAARGKGDFGGRRLATCQKIKGKHPIAVSKSQSCLLGPSDVR